MTNDATNNDIGAIRKQYTDWRTGVTCCPTGGNPCAICLQRADDVAREVPALCDEVEQLRPFETAVLRMLVLAGDEYRQAIVAARASVSGDDYAKNNARAEMIRVFATGLAERAGLPATDWEQIKRAVPADGVYRTEVKG